MTAPTANPTSAAAGRYSEQRPARVGPEVGGRVAAGAEEERVAEADLAGVAGEQVEADGADGVDAAQREHAEHVAG